jgi:hypothetical protein
LCTVEKLGLFRLWKEDFTVKNTQKSLGQDVREVSGETEI